MTIRFAVLAILSGALSLPLTRLTTITTADLADVQYWLAIATLAISGGAASTVTVLAIASRQAALALGVEKSAPTSTPVP